jgi:diadenosine tetraphosphate (Ap4A) HIT family hydrolase
VVARYINYAWLGNYFHVHEGHGHMHFIPRYKTSRTFAGFTFIDNHWGANYPTAEELKLSSGVLFAIRDELRAALKSSTD